MPKLCLDLLAKPQDTRGRGRAQSPHLILFSARVVVDDKTVPLSAGDDSRNRKLNHNRNIRSLAGFSIILLVAAVFAAALMISGLAILVIGFFLGMRHATDPDHVIAVSTIVTRERSLSKAALIGALWGLGHTLTILVVGAAIILFNLVIPPRLGLTMELAVGLMLVLLGVLNLAGVTKWLSEKFSPAHPHVAGGHAHIHEHGSRLHYHWHEHAPAKEHHGDSLPAPRWLSSPFAKLGLFHSLRPLFIGIVHGLAGSAAVALLVLTTIHSPRWGVLYLLIFGAGTVGGMILITAALSLPFSYASSRFAWMSRGLVTASGLLSLGFGLFISYQIGFVDGLFTSHPNWTPR